MQPFDVGSVGPIATDTTCTHGIVELGEGKAGGEGKEGGV